MQHGCAVVAFILGAAPGPSDPAPDRKADVAGELPPKTEQTIFVQFGRSQLSLYNRILKAAKSRSTPQVE